ncbi:MAG: cobalamin B12-binding domain-containing protein [Elusimicrobiota bacterium]
MVDTKKRRILIAKPGLDGHDRGAKVIVRSLRDAGFEVIYTGIRQTAEMIARTALQEDVDAVGLSLLSGSHMTLFPKVIELLKKSGLDNVLVLGGGIIPDEDVPLLKKKGVAEVFGPGTSTDDIVSFLRARFAQEAAPSKPRASAKKKKKKSRNAGR